MNRMNKINRMNNCSKNFGEITNDYSLNKYGNISISDIDMTRQQRFTSFKKSNFIDNSDVIEEVLSGGSSLFQPNGGGYSPVNAVYRQPKKFNSYLTPLTGSQNVDELLARKMQQRGTMNYQSMTGTARVNKDIYQKYYFEELNENQHKNWFSSGSYDLETDWQPY